MRLIEIPTKQDDPQWLIIWQVDELLPIAVLGSIGILNSQAVILTVIGYLIARAYRRVKYTRHKVFMVHWLFIHGIGLSTSHTIHNSFERYFIPS